MYISKNIHIHKHTLTNGNLSKLLFMTIYKRNLYASAEIYLRILYIKVQLSYF